ncbi:hypothetical protein LAZ40_04830 [Cereibacter sphaeroides]|uniref:hypothetical protein n=1 Tax=Cereibacter sphaeroides TaxID=1063 RepID=UPI001F201253|nr:hypothetical protein [Cereibacter sphaeroides]MCE6958381.1 hypothetical protein [Cereibacter sphaeroides]MCE6972248.1 hypothetical protein [Cereibacter sphaeroides]
MFALVPVTPAPLVRIAILLVSAAALAGLSFLLYPDSLTGFRSASGLLILSLLFGRAIAGTLPRALPAP